MDNSLYSRQGYYTPEDLKNALHLLWIQKILWTRLFMISAISHLKDIDVVANRLMENVMDFTNVLKIYYNSTTITAFDQLYREHLRLTMSLIKGYAAHLSPVQIAEIEDAWYKNADQLSAFLSNINPYWDRDTLRNGFKNHLDMAKDEVTKRINGEYAADVDAYNFIEYQALMLADIMAKGLIEQFYT
jgi:hypothetical protein